MTDPKQSAFARRLSNLNQVTLRSTSENKDIDLQLQVNNLFGYYGELEKYAKNTNGQLQVLQSIVDAINLTQLTNVEFIDFSTTAVVTPQLGKIYWDTEYSTLMVGIDAHINAAVGQAMYKKIRNNTGAQITKGQVLYVTGSHGASHITVGLADASVEATAATTIGLAAEDIDNNTEGYIITQGYLKGITTNTLAGSEGSAIWLSETTGAMTTIRPTQPAHGVHLGWLVKKAGGGAGSVYVKITNGQELDEIHDVLITTPSNDDVLTYESATGLWKNKPATGGAVLVNSVTASLNFGSNANSTGAETIVSGLTWLGSNTMLVLEPTSSTDHTAEDALIDEIRFAVTKRVVGSSITIQAYAPNGTYGTYNVLCKGI